MEASVAIAQENGHAPAFPRPDHEVIMAVSIQVAASHARAELAQAPWQERLERKIIEWFIFVLMTKDITAVSEKLRRRRSPCDLRDRCAPRFPRRAAKRLVDLIKPVGPHIIDAAAPA